MYIMRRTHRSVAARVVLTMAAAVTLGSCATKGDLRSLQIEIRMLAARQDTLLAQLRVETLSTQDSVRTQSDQIFDFRGEITRQLRDISRTLATLEALAGQNQQAIAGVRSQMANLRPAERAPPPTATDDSTRALAQGGAGDPDELYRAAQEQMDRGSLVLRARRSRSSSQCIRTMSSRPTPTTSWPTSCFSRTTSRMRSRRSRKSGRGSRLRPRFLIRCTGSL